jgi:hypothetical protein
LVGDHVAWNKLFRRQLLLDHGLSFPEDTYCEDVVFALSAYMHAAAVDIVPDVVYRHRRRATSITGGLMRPDTMNDWMTQLSDAAALLVRWGDSAASRIFYARLLAREAWSRVRDFNQIREPETLMRFEAFLGRLLDAAPESARAFTGQFKLQAAEAIANGVIRRAWPSGISRSPFREPPSHVTASDVDPTLIRRLWQDGGAPDLSRALADRWVVAPLVRQLRTMDDVEGLRLLATMAALWPAGLRAADARGFALSPESLHLLVQCARAADLARARVIVGSELENCTARIVGVASSSDRVLMTGDFRWEGPELRDAELSVVFRSVTSERVRVHRVRSWVAAESNLLSWNTTLGPDLELRGDTWRMWLRVDRVGLARREYVLHRDNGLAEYVDPGDDSRHSEGGIHA